VRVAVADGPLGDKDADEVADAFHDAHRALYGYDFRDNPAQQVEWVNLRVSGIGPIRRPDLVGADAIGDRPEPGHTGHRPVCFEADGSYRTTPVYARTALGPGATITGPAIIEEYGSTVPLHPGFTVRVDSFANLIVTRAAA
jgi:N-methylhydantoinase A